MSWDSKAEEITVSEEEKAELLGVAQEMAENIKYSILESTTSKRIECDYGVKIFFNGTGTDLVREVRIMMLFTVSGVDSSGLNTVRKYIRQKLLMLLATPEKRNYSVGWTAEIG